MSMQNSSKLAKPKITPKTGVTHLPSSWVGTNTTLMITASFVRMERHGTSSQTHGLP